ncbi:hypothetical protein ACNKHL_23750 [Shigella flexneri]
MTGHGLHHSDVAVTRLLDEAQQRAAAALVRSQRLHADDGPTKVPRPGDNSLDGDAEALAVCPYDLRLHHPETLP